jgi:hypothetical protein
MQQLACRAAVGWDAEELTMAKQLLHLVFGDELKDPGGSSSPI